MIKHCLNRLSVVDQYQLIDLINSLKRYNTSSVDSEDYADVALYNQALRDVKNLLFGTL